MDSKQWCNKWTVQTHRHSISCFLDCLCEKWLLFLSPSKNIKAVRASMMKWLYAEIVLRQQFSIPFLRWIKLPTEIPRFCIHINLCSFIAIYHFNNYSSDSLKLSKAFSGVSDFKLSISIMWHNLLWKLLFWNCKQNHL